MTRKELVDMSILLGCDFCPKISGIGPKSAPGLIRQHRTIETVIQNLDRNKFEVPKNFNYESAREVFLNPEVIPADKLKTNSTKPDETGLTDYLISIGMSEKNANLNVKKLVHHFQVFLSFNIFGLNNIITLNKNSIYYKEYLRVFCIKNSSVFTLFVTKSIWLIWKIVFDCFAWSCALGKFVCYLAVNKKIKIKIWITLLICCYATELSHDLVLSKLSKWRGEHRVKTNFF